MAIQNLRKPDMETHLRRWWTKKYRLPWTHECAQDACLEDLLAEYYEDFFAKYPEELRKERSVDGEFYFDGTGDALLDKWEQELQKGLTPDLEEGLSPAERAKLEKERARYKGARRASETLGDVQDDYTKAQYRDPRYASKFITPGSKEEAEMLQDSVLGSGKVSGRQQRITERDLEDFFDDYR